MVLQEKHNEKTVSRPVLQDSPFLRLPPELRDYVYEFVACNSETISVDINGVLYSPPLSLVCLQIRQEFEGIYINDAPKYAKVVKIHLVNFIHETRIRNIVGVLYSLPALEPGRERTITVHVFLTNTFDRYIHQIRSRFFTPLINGQGCKLEIFWEPKTFDVHYSRQLLTKLRHSLVGVKIAMIGKAFEEAFERYEPKVQGNVRKRKRR